MVATCGGEVDNSPPSSSSSGTGAATTTSATDTSSTTDTGGTTGSTSSGGGTTGSGGAAGGSTSTGGGGGGSGCAKDCQKDGFICCGSICVNPLNDFNNCGGCGIICNNNPPFCAAGKCGKPPCGGQTCIGTKFCCGTSCCELNELCCEVQSGGPAAGPTCHKPNEQGTCPKGCPKCVCAAPDTPVATPNGERPIASLERGDLVYSVHRGQLRIVPVARINSIAVHNHSVVELILEDGRQIRISARHPTGDGRTIGQLSAGDMLGGLTIRSSRLIKYDHERTYDILPDSDSGTYFAAGALIGSTLADESAAKMLPLVSWALPRR